MYRLKMGDENSVILGSVQTARILEWSWTRESEASVDLGLNVKRSALEAAIGVLLKDGLVMTLSIFAAFEHGRHDML